MTKRKKRLILRSTLLSALLIALPVAMVACGSLRNSRPILPVAEYERMIVGRVDAEYIGTDNCVSQCHQHDKITDDFKHSVHGEQIKPSTGLPLVNCESCHGPGSLAIANLEEAKKQHGSKAKCESNTLLDLKSLPPRAQSLICLKCHSTASTPALSHWNSSSHALNEVSCFACHKLHEGPQQKVNHEKMAELCYQCHPDVKTQFSLFSHHPVREKKMDCFDCHDPHGSNQSKMLKGATVRDTCTRCHMEKSGPFVFEHGDVTENCSNCHSPHGSVTRKLVNTTMPYLCLQCHPGPHQRLLSADPREKAIFARRCTDCHTMIHGSDTPDRQGRGTLRR